VGENATVASLATLLSCLFVQRLNWPWMLWFWKRVYILTMRIVKMYAFVPCQGFTGLNQLRLKGLSQFRLLDVNHLLWKAWMSCSLNSRRPKSYIYGRPRPKSYIYGSYILNTTWKTYSVNFFIVCEKNVGLFLPWSFLLALNVCQRKCRHWLVCSTSCARDGQQVCCLKGGYLNKPFGDNTKKSQAWSVEISWFNSWKVCAL
jgi:hypothetical protein